MIETFMTSYDYWGRLGSHRLLGRARVMRGALSEAFNFLVTLNSCLAEKAPRVSELVVNS